MAQSRRKSLFSGGRHSIAETLTTSTQNSLSLEDKQRLLARAAIAEVQMQNFSGAPLAFTKKVHSRNLLVERSHDFSELVEKWPKHRKLLSQLIHGLLLLNPDGVSVSTLADSAKAVRSFISFLNEPQSLTNISVLTVGDIDTLVLHSYSNFLSHDATLKKRASVFYSKLVSICKKLWSEHKDTAEIGEAPTVPDAPPSPETKGQNGYNLSQLEALIAACIKDIKAVKALHRWYDGLGPDATQFIAGQRIMIKKGPEYHEKKFSVILATLKHQYPNYPFRMTLDEARTFLTRDNPSSHVGVIKGAVDDSIAKIEFMGGRLGKAAIFAAQHFTVDTLYPFFLLAQINTGWNFESVATIPDDVDRSVMDNPLNPDQEVIIIGRKERSGSNGKNVHRRSRKGRPFGPYELLKYVESISRRQQASEHYVEGDLFQYVVGKFTDVRIVGTIRNNACRSGVLSRTTTDFLRRHQLTALIGETVDHVKIRSGYATLCEARGMAPEEIAEQQLEHATVATTVSNYLSDDSSNAVKDRIIASVQRLYVEDMANYDLRIIESVSLQELRKSIESAKNQAERQAAIGHAARITGLEEKTVVHLLTPDADTYILACEDAGHPTWPGHKEHVKEQPCRYFNKCCLCERAIVFPEALPYIARRIGDLDKEKHRIMTADWICHYGEEYEAWQSILDSWSDRNAVSAATDAAERGTVVLPHVMRGYW